MKLTQEQMNLLTKGLSFVPTMHLDMFKTLLDFNTFVRMLTVKKYAFHYDASTLPTDVDDLTTDSLARPTNELCELSFQEQCGLHSLQDLQSSQPCKYIDSKVNYTKLYLYPINSRTPAIDAFQNANEKDLKNCMMYPIKILKVLI